MSTFKWLLGLLIVAIVLTVFLHINILQSRPLLLVFAGVIIVLLIIAFLEVIGRAIGIAVSIAAFLFLVYLLMIAFKMLT